MRKPTCELIGEDGNVFFIIGRVCKTLRRNDMENEAKEYEKKAMNVNSYDEVLQLTMEYVEVE